ncbi:unnamed protein product, partial [Musa textilis]
VYIDRAVLGVSFGECERGITGTSETERFRAPLIPSFASRLDSCLPCFTVGKSSDFSCSSFYLLLLDPKRLGLRDFGAKMLCSPADSDGEIVQEALNSMSSGGGSCDERRSGFSRVSYDAASMAALELSFGDLHCGAFASKPHRSSDPAWAAIRSRTSAGGARPSDLGHRDFKLVRRIGRGNMGTVYLCRLRGEASQCMYAMKVMDKLALAKKKKKLERAATERRILRVLDHPFLPTLYAAFDKPPRYSCLVMEYCSGGDLHTLRLRQPHLRFSVSATRFFAAEVLLALEYLHMLGIVYRDLKPENILIRADGHIMLTDFDLSLVSTASPTLEPLTASEQAAELRHHHRVGPSCLPFRARRLFRRILKPDRRFVAEPVVARSSSFVGTHEYVAPEIAGGGPHGSAVDWWAYGVLLYELLYGRTPFAGETHEATLRNIVTEPLVFPPPSSPSSRSSDSAARDLIAHLLDKDPEARLGSQRGAADVKEHAFFRGLNFALMRSHRPPDGPGS